MGKKPGKSGGKSQLPVLIIQHAQYEHPAAIKRALEAQGILTHWIHPYRGDAYPELSSLSGVISLGGPMGANDEKEFPWLIREMALLRASVEAGMPTVGVCLGGQLMARALGSKVERNPIPEVGWFPVEVNGSGKSDPLVGADGEAPLLYQWHYDTFHLPSGAELLASSKACPRQAYRIGEHAYGFQFHPEADHQLVHEWLAISGVEAELKKEQDAHGAHTVQDAETQRLRAAIGERSSLKLTAGIGQLFQSKPYAPDDRHLKESFVEWAAQRTLLVLEVIGSDGNPIRIKGTVATLMSVPAGEFVFFREENAILWPIRLDHIRKVML